MDQNRIAVLAKLAYNSAHMVDRGVLDVLVDPEDLPIYQALHKGHYIKCPKTRSGGNIYRISRKGFNALPRDVRDDIIHDYMVWRHKFAPTIPEAEWWQWTNMKKYLVGGAVRDRHIHRPIKDHDFVWTGTTVSDMESMGFNQVGADFPVFLDEDGQEHALARTEEKTGPGYHGFDTRFDPSITIQEDLARRDLTINAMAYCVTDDPECENLIDPYNGMEDLKNGILRHVSDAFKEDPVRILRVARFAARYNFEVHEDTMKLMSQMVNDGEFHNLTAERVWNEMNRAIVEPHPEVFFYVLSDCKALDVLVESVFPKGNVWRLHHLECCASVSLNEDWQRWVSFFDGFYEEEALSLLKLWKAPKDIQHKVKMSFSIVNSKTSAVSTHKLMKQYHLTKEDSYKEFIQVSQMMMLATHYIQYPAMAWNLIKQLEAIRHARIVKADTVIAMFPKGEAPEGKALGDAIAEEQKKVLRKYLREQ